MTASKPGSPSQDSTQVTTLGVISKCPRSSKAFRHSPHALMAALNVTSVRRRRNTPKCQKICSANCHCAALPQAPLQSLRSSSSPTTPLAASGSLFYNSLITWWMPEIWILQCHDCCLLGSCHKSQFMQAWEVPKTQRTRH